MRRPRGIRASGSATDRRRARCPGEAAFATAGRLVSRWPRTLEPRGYKV
jgi:hypothetical protein